MIIINMYRGNVKREDSYSWRFLDFNITLEVFCFVGIKIWKINNKLH